MPVPSKAVQQDGHLDGPTSYGYDAPSRFQKWAQAGAGTYSSFLHGLKSDANPTSGNTATPAETINKGRGPFATTARRLQTDEHHMNALISVANTREAVPGAAAPSTDNKQLAVDCATPQF
jgi:hypothetical protein